MQNEVKPAESEGLIYRGRDRYGMAFAVKRGGHAVAVSGPTRVDAYAGETVRWTLVNASDHEVVFELAEVHAIAGGPPSPFVEPLPRRVPVRPNLADEVAKAELVLTVRPRGTFPEGHVTRYQYEIRIHNVADSGADPELDIYP